MPRRDPPLPAGPLRARAGLRCASEIPVQAAVRDPAGAPPSERGGHRHRCDEHGGDGIRRRPRRLRAQGAGGIRSAGGPVRRHALSAGKTQERGCHGRSGEPEGVRAPPRTGSLPARVSLRRQCAARAHAVGADEGSAGTTRTPMTSKRWLIGLSSLVVMLTIAGAVSFARYARLHAPPPTPVAVPPFDILVPGLEPWRVRPAQELPPGHASL